MLTRQQTNGPAFFYNATPNNGETYVVMPEESGDLRLAETVARYYGGHVTSIRNESEFGFLTNWLHSVPMIALTENYYIVGLDDEGHPGQFQWTDGSPMTFTDWKPGEPVIPTWGHRLVVAADE